MSAVEQAEQAIKTVTDRWDEPLDEVHDIPQITRALATAGLLRAEPVTVATVEELDALPSGSVVLTADHVALQKDRHGRWGWPSMPSTLVAELGWKPATVLYRPGDDR